MVVSPDLVTQYIAVIDGRLVEYLLAKHIQIHTSLFVARKFWQMSNNGANVTSDSAGKQLDIYISLSALSPNCRCGPYVVGVKYTGEIKISYFANRVTGLCYVQTHSHWDKG